MSIQRRNNPAKKLADLLYREEVFAIVGAAIEVHRHLGSGFSEAVYQEAFDVELTTREIPFDPQRTLQVFYNGKALKKEYIADFVCYDKIIVEIKALDQLTGREESQLINYLKATGLRLGLLINFGSSGQLEWKRIIV